MDKEKLIDIITEQVVQRMSGAAASTPAPSHPSPTRRGSASGLRIPVGVSNRHLHVCREHLDVLYGKGYELQKRNPLKQPGEFAAQETVTLVGPRHAIERVRILGPIRKRTQVEISQTDAFALGIRAPVRTSGDIDGTPGVTIVGPRGTVVLEEGVIRANRHIHIVEEDAQRLGLTNKQIVAVKTIDADKQTVFHDVMVRVLKKGFLEIHIDTDDGNAAGLKSDDEVELIV